MPCTSMPVTEDSQPPWEFSPSWVDDMAVQEAHVAVHRVDVAVHGADVAVHGADHNVFGQEAVDGLHMAGDGWPEAAVGHVSAHPAAPGSHIFAPGSHMIATRSHMVAPSSCMGAPSIPSSYRGHLTPSTGLGDAAAMAPHPTSVPSGGAFRSGARVSACGAIASPVWGPAGCCYGQPAVPVMGVPCGSSHAVVAGHAPRAQPWAVGSDWAAGGLRGAAAMDVSPNLDGSLGGTAPPSTSMAGSWGAVLDALYNDDGDGEVEEEFANDPLSPIFKVDLPPPPPTSQGRADRGRDDNWTPLGRLLPPEAAAILPLCRPPLIPPCHPPRSAPDPLSPHTAVANLPRYPTIFPQEQGTLNLRNP